VRREPRRLPPDAGLMARLDAPYLPLARAQWVQTAQFGSASERAIAREAWNRSEFGFFRWFAVYPVLHRVEIGNPYICAWFEDLRFFTPGRGRMPFRFGMCREEGGGWELFQLVDGRERVSVR